MMNYLIKLILLAVVFKNFVKCENGSAGRSDADIASQLVQTNNGAVRGKVLETLRHKITYYSFKGIPYAKVPTGELRFKAPEKMSDWSPDVHDAAEYGNSCFQSSILNAKVEQQSEDCLFLNIFTPDVGSDEKLPVIFYIHGGGFIEGSGNEFYGPDFLIEERVIVVTINYRLGVFGFLSLGLPKFSGNMGLKDQQMALEWIHENIHHFGGDKKRITIAGHSAGGASAHYHTLSEKSRKLFARAIVMSGSAFNRWALSEKDNDEDIFNMFAIAYDLGENARNDEDLVEFLERIPADELMKHTMNSRFTRTEGEPKDTFIEWNPTVENEDAYNPFLTAEPDSILKNATITVDTMFGFTAEEWLSFATAEIENPAILRHFNEHFHVELPFRGCKLDYESKEYRELADEVRQYYFGANSIIDNDNIVAYIDMLSDIFIFYHLDKSAKLQANASTGKTFYFRFSVDSKFNLFKILGNVDLPGSGHEDDRCYIFRCQALDEKYQELFDDPENVNSIAYRSIERMTQLWCNFAKNGSPNVPIVNDVKPISGNNIHLLDIRDKGFGTVLSPNRHAVAFWDQLHRKYQNILDKTNEIERDEL